MSRLFVLAAALIGFVSPALAAGIVVPPEQWNIPIVGDPLACDDTIVVWKVTYHMNDKESEYWAGPKINEIRDIKQIGLRANGNQYIPRRYCVGTARMSDHKDRRVVYQVLQSMGFAGYTVGVESCVVGLDHNFAYAPACSALRPFVERYKQAKVQLTYP
jgi:hypothetical protein